MKKLLLPVSLFTLAIACWLALMEILLRHPGYGTRVGVAACIALISLFTLLVRLCHAGIRVERCLWSGAVVLIAIGCQAFLRNVRAAHFEGYIFIIAMVIVFQGLLMLATLGRAKGTTNQNPLIQGHLSRRAPSVTSRILFS